MKYVWYRNFFFRAILIVVGVIAYTLIDKWLGWDVRFLAGWAAMDIYWEFFRKSKESK